jgi:hypothetical protein
LRTTTGTYLAYNDDYCGVQSQINWTATFSGQVRVILDRYYCSNYNSCMNLNVTRGAAAVNPCNSISSLSCGTTGSFSLSSGSGSWNPTSGPWGTPGKEKVFSFTPALSGSHSIAVTNSSGWVDLFYKSGSCGSTGWTYVSDILSSETNSVTLTAGVTYYFLIDDENTSANSGTITVNCPTPAANPCNSITNIAACGTSASYSLSSGTGSWNPPGPWGTPGKEAVFSYTAPVTGAYPITVTNSGGYVDLFYKTGTCSSSGWTYVIDILSNETNTVNLVGGVTYLFLIDDENTSASSGTINIACPCIPPPGGIDGSYTYTSPFTISGTTVGACNDCSLRSSNDRVYAVNVTCAGSYTFSMCGGASWDTYLYLRTAACGGSSIAINDDACGLQSSVTANLLPGTYYIHVEGFSVSSQGSFNMSVTGTGSAPSITGSATNATCFGASNGSITANVNGNGNTASATLNGASFNGSASGLAAGPYTLSASNCWGTSSQTFTVGQPTVLTSASTSGSIACNGGTTTVSVSAAGGTAPYSGTGSYTVTAGMYSYTVTDANGCTSTTTITVSEPTVLTSASTSGSIACNGGTTTVSVSAAGGTAPYSGDGNYTVGAGTYSYTITDANGCASTTSITVTEPTALGASNVASDFNGYGVSCNGGSNGSVIVSATGGTTPYSGDGAYINLSAGNYSYTVTDANGCTASTSATITEPDPLVVDAGSDQTVFYGYTPASCAELAGTAVGGIPSYTYSWSDGSTSNLTTVCPSVSSDYTLTVTDQNGCSATDEVHVCVVDVTCFAGNSQNQKVEVCHTPPGNSGNSHTICINESAVAAHLAHGCSLGACDEQGVCSTASSRMSVSELHEEHSIELLVSPNPFIDRIEVEMFIEEDGVYEIELVNTYGQIIRSVYSGSLISTEQNKFEISTQELGKGIYFLRARSNDSQVVLSKILKM